MHELKPESETVVLVYLEITLVHSGKYILDTKFKIVHINLSVRQ